MKTKIIISDGWQEIVEYNFPLYLNRGDRLTFEKEDYVVEFSDLNIDENCIMIQIKKD